MKTVTRRQFMRGTDPIKSTWECPKYSNTALCAMSYHCSVNIF